MGKCPQRHFSLMSQQCRFLCYAFKLHDLVGTNFHPSSFSPRRAALSFAVSGIEVVTGLTNLAWSICIYDLHWWHKAMSIIWLHEHAKKITHKIKIESLLQSATSYLLSALPGTYLFHRHQHIHVSHPHNITIKPISTIYATSSSFQ